MKEIIKPIIIKRHLAKPINQKSRKSISEVLEKIETANRTIILIDRKLSFNNKSPEYIETLKQDKKEVITRLEVLKWFLDKR